MHGVYVCSIFDSRDFLYRPFYESKTTINALCTLRVIIYGSRGWRVGGSVRGSFYIEGGIDEEGGADDEG